MVQERYALDKVMQDTLIPWSATEEGKAAIKEVVEIHVSPVPFVDM